MRRLFVLSLLCLALVLAGCGEVVVETTVETIASVYHTITPAEVKEMMDAGQKLTLVDVRTNEEYAEGHIPTAILISNESIFDVRPETLPDPDATIVVYCRSGRRSREAVDKLVGLGYTDVRDLGGIIDWPYETITGGNPGKWTVSAPTGVLGSFSTTDLEGNAVTQAVLAKYQLTMVNVWATYCGPCLSEMPELGELAAEYQEKNVQIIGLVSDVLNSDGSLSQRQVDIARDAVSHTKADYLHIVPSQDLFGVLNQISAVPTTFFVDSEGNQVGQVLVGARSKAQWAAVLDSLLAEVSQ